MHCYYNKNLKRVALACGLAAGDKETDIGSWDTRDLFHRTITYDAWEVKLCIY